VGQRFLSEAFNQVRLPDGGQVCLKLSAEATGDLSFFQQAGFENLSELHLPASAVSAQQLQFVSSLVCLKRLKMSYSRVGDQAHSFLLGLKNLEELRLNWTEVGDATLESIGALERLAVLDLSKTRVTDAGIARLKSIAGSLKTLVLWDTKVIGSGFAELGGDCALSEVWLSRSAICDRYVSQIAALPGLMGLRLAQTAIGDDGVAQLCHSAQLTDLDISDTRVTDDCIKYLLEIKALRRLQMLNSGLSASAVSELQKNRSELQISYQPRPRLSR
jgi:hypothetical protein